MPKDDLSRPVATLAQSRLEESIVLLLIDLGNRLTRFGEMISAQVDLTVQQWLVLLQIAGDPSFPSDEENPAGGTGAVLSSRIAADRGVSRALISATVSQLMKRGLVEQTDDPQDRRRKHLTVTDRGMAALNAVQEMRLYSNDSLLEGFSDDERALLRQQLRSMWGRATQIDDTLSRWRAEKRQKTSA